MIDVQIIEDSIDIRGSRLTTFSLVYPRIIHGEMLTHRVFSRNASSSRAIPVLKQIKEVEERPFIPAIFLKNRKGMQAIEPIEDQEAARKIWLIARDRAVEQVNQLAALNIHKEYCNRLLESFSYISVVLTGTTFNNFFDLRMHKDAQPEIQELSKQMWKKYMHSTPIVRGAGQWHLPFVTTLERIEKNYDINVLLTHSVARCARVSYKKHDGTESSLEEDRMLYEKLLGSVPRHNSPAEHQAMCSEDPSIKSGNFNGWIQYRQMIK